MSDTCISIVPKTSNYPNKKEKAQEVLNWLIAEDIINPKPTDCILSKTKLGYAISEGARRVTDSSVRVSLKLDEKGNLVQVPMIDYIPIDMRTNGLEIITERKIFIADEGYVETIKCPACKSNLDIDYLDFSKWQNSISDYLTCPQCKKVVDVNQFIFNPEWGFSDLGFKFWNWPPFRENFIHDFKKILKCDIRVINERI